MLDGSLTAPSPDSPASQAPAASIASELRDAWLLSRPVGKRCIFDIRHAHPNRRQESIYDDAVRMVTELPTTTGISAKRLSGGKGAFGDLDVSVPSRRNHISETQEFR